MAQRKIMPRNVLATYKDTSPTPGDFLKQAKPNVQPYPIMLNRPVNNRQFATDKPSFFRAVNKSGTSAIGKVPEVQENNP